MTVRKLRQVSFAYPEATALDEFLAALEAYHIVASFFPIPFDKCSRQISCSIGSIGHSGEFLSHSLWQLQWTNFLQHWKCRTFPVVVLNP